MRRTGQPEEAASKNDPPRADASLPPLEPARTLESTGGSAEITAAHRDIRDDGGVVKRRDVVRALAEGACLA